MRTDLKERDGNQVRVTITTRRPAEALCTQALVDFTETVKLDGGFPPGDYMTFVNDYRAELTID